MMGGFMGGMGGAMGSMGGFIGAMGAMGGGMGGAMDGNEKQWVVHWRRSNQWRGSKP